MRREADSLAAPLNQQARPLAAWQNSECTEASLLLAENLLVGACGGPYTVFPWAQGELPEVMRGLLATYAPFEAETPAGKLRFNGLGTETAAPAEQRALADFLIATHPRATPYAEADTPAAQDTRIQNLSVRAEALP